jgi:hypothetical protein
VGTGDVTGRDVVRFVAVVLLFEVVQQSLVLDLRVGSVHADIMVLLPILAGVIGGPSLSLIHI